jgi:hypothetical protein
MSYVSVNAPLPPNSMQRPPQCIADWGNQIVRDVNTAVANAKKASNQVASPASFATLGQGVVNDVTRSQAELLQAQKLNVDAANYRNETMGPTPTVLPLNVTTREYSGCVARGVGPIQPIPISPKQQQVQMPVPAPTDTQLLVQPGTVYTPPAAPVVAQTPPVIFMGGPGPVLPTAPPMLFHVRESGMGAIAWGDAGTYSRVNGNGNGIAGKSLLLLALAGLGLYAASRKGR